MIVVTTNDLPGYRIVRVIGLVRGITVRSRSIIGTIGGALQSIVGGNITLFTSLAETARQEALDLMIKHAEEAGANAVIAMRYDGNEITDGITEMLAYGTAVVVEQI
ncbi:MAG: heavy metal-binding domain-containing protein [Devosia sp.]